MMMTTTYTKQEMDGFLRQVIDAYQCVVGGLSLSGIDDDGSMRFMDRQHRSMTFSIGNLSIVVTIAKDDAKSAWAYTLPHHIVANRSTVLEHLAQFAKCEESGDAQALTVELAEHEADSFILVGSQATSPTGFTINGMRVYGKQGERVVDEAMMTIDGVSRKAIEATDHAFVAIGYAAQSLCNAAVKVLRKVEAHRALRVSGLPYLIEDLSDEFTPLLDGEAMAILHGREVDRRETREEWTARKTKDLEARFASIIRHGLREWPTHHGLPMAIHTEVNEGVFVLTLKAAP